MLICLATIFKNLDVIPIFEDQPIRIDDNGVMYLDEKKKEQYPIYKEFRLNSDFSLDTIYNDKDKFDYLYFDTLSIPEPINLRYR